MVFGHAIDCGVGGASCVRPFQHCDPPCLDLKRWERGGGGVFPSLNAVSKNPCIPSGHADLANSSNCRDW